MMHAPAPAEIPDTVPGDGSSSPHLWAVPATGTTLVVLPTYDERENIESVLRRVRAAVPLAHVLVVDDASPDGTAELADALARELGGISVLRRPGPGGLGSAYRDGFRWGLERGYDVMVEMDADLSHDPAVLPVLLRRIDAGADLVIGSRYVPGGVSADWSFARRAISRIGCRYAQVMLRLPTARRHLRVPRVPRGRAPVRRSGHVAGQRLRVPGRDGLPGPTGRRCHRRGAHRVPRPHRRHVEDVASDRHRGAGAGDEVGCRAIGCSLPAAFQCGAEHRDHPPIALPGRCRPLEHARVLQRDVAVDARPHRPVGVHLGRALQAE